MIKLWRIGLVKECNLVGPPSFLDSYRTLSKALEEFEMGSRREVSLMGYTVLMIKVINCQMSALEVMVIDMGCKKKTEPTQLCHGPSLKNWIAFHTLILSTSQPLNGSIDVQNFFQLL